MMIIDYVEKSGRFIISSPPWMADQIRRLPNRRWDPKGKVWTAPAIRVNKEHIKAYFKDAKMTDAAKEVIAAPSGSKSAVLGSSKFPARYQFKTSPYNHQRDALNKLHGSNVAGLLMEMGTGKTKILIDMMCAYNHSGEVDAVVVVCPVTIRRTWAKELSVHATADHSYHILDTTKQKAFDEWCGSSHQFKWLVVGVESLATGRAAGMVERFLLTTTRSAMIVDESHKIKTHSANRSKVCVKLGRMAEKRYISTGTFIANSPMDAFMQFEFLDPNIIGVGDFYSFRNRYAIMGGYENKQVIGYQNMDELIELVSPFIYQAKKADVLDLPPKVYETREVEMSSEQAKLYKQMAKNKYIETDRGVLTVQTVLEKMLRMQEIVGGILTYENIDSKEKFRKELIQFDGYHPKVAEVIDIAESTDESIIIWCVYRSEIDMVSRALRDKFGDHQVVEMHGGVDEEVRHHNVENVFQKRKARFLVGNAATGGVGLTITAATIEVYFSNSFNLVDRLQSEDRAHRAGQTKSVTIIDLVAKGTVDEIVVEALSNKQDVANYVSGRISEVSKRLSIV